MDWANDHWRGGSGDGGLPDGVFYPKRIAMLGADIYRRSEYTIIPDPAELAKIDPKWLSSLNTLCDLIDKAKPDDN